MKRFISLIVVIVCLWAVAWAIPSQRLIRPPRVVLGFDPGQDRHLAPWPDIVNYFQILADSSSRVQVRELGRSTLDRPVIVAIISSEANLRKVDRIREIQRLLADPRLIADDDAARRLVNEGKMVVVVSCSIHSTEIVASQMSMELGYRLATDNSPDTLEILENTVVLLFPSINPDGIDIVSSWYEKTLGTPFEGTDPPELYHHYIGHDNNRDWFMLTQVETQHMTRFLYHEWFPQIVYDVHQMGSYGARMFVPPFYDPANPNIDPLILREVARVGSHMAASLTAAGFKGILTNSQFDTWWHGGLRTAPYYHNSIGILSEAASARLMSPIEVQAGQLKGNRSGFGNPLSRATNFPDPWPGGLWQPRDIFDMEMVATRSVLQLASRYKNEIMFNLYLSGRRAIEAGRSIAPFAYLIPPEQHDPATATRMINLLIEQGIEVHQAQRTFIVDGVRYPIGTLVILMAQPFRASVKALLEPQVYPNSGATDEDEGLQPYDVAGWTLPFQMGVRAIEIDRAFQADLVRIRAARPRDVGGEPPADGQEARVWVLRPQANAAYAMVNEVMASETPIRVGRLKEDMEIEGRLYERGSFVFSPEPGLRRDIFSDMMSGLSVRHSVKLAGLSRIPQDVTSELLPKRIGLYRSWVPSMDEGWTRWVLEQYGFDYDVVRDADIRSENLWERFDAIILPDQAARQILEGHPTGKYPQPYTGGVGLAGFQNLKAFVQHGGQLVCFGRAGQLVAEHFDFPVRDVLGQTTGREFSCPGSILGIEVDNLHPLGFGMPAQSMAVFRRSPVFEVLDIPASRNVRVVARFAKSDVLKSGYLHGESYIAGRPAVLDVKVGRGRVIMIGFSPQHRGQSHGTFKFLFNALVEVEIARQQEQ